MSLFHSYLKLVSVIIIQNELSIHSKGKDQYLVFTEQIILLSLPTRKSEDWEIMGDISIWRADRATPVSTYSSNFISSKFDKVLYLHTQELVFPGILIWFQVTTSFFSPVILACVRKIFKKKKKEFCLFCYLSSTRTRTILECI